MGGAANFERAGLLQLLTLEKYIDFWDAGNSNVVFAEYGATDGM